MEKFKKIIKEYGIYVLIIIIVLLIKTYVVSPIVVSGDSMDSTLKDGDVMLLDKFNYDSTSIERFDIIVVKYNNKHIIKRIIGMPGDTIEYTDNMLYINGKVYTEKYLDENTVTEDFKVNLIPEGKYFVLGDNREVSLDSRKIGLVDEQMIEGHAKYTIFPFNRFGKKE